MRMASVEQPSLVVNAGRGVTVEWSTSASCGELYWAMTEGLGDWLAEPNTLSIVVDVGAAFFVESLLHDEAPAHYGRFVELQPDRRIAMTWIGESTAGVETEVVIVLIPTPTGADIRVDHTGLSERWTQSAATEMWERARIALDAAILDPRR